MRCAPVVDKADRSLKPISIALGVFGAVSLLAALLIAAQLISRRFRTDGGDLQILRALGAGPSDTMFDHLIGMEVSILIGSLLAVAVAVAVSPLAPLGPVRPVYPSGGFSFDWTVLGFGAVALVVLLSTTAALLAYATAPHRTALRPRIRSTSGARVVASLAGVPAPGVVGARMALEPGEGRSAVPVRSALLGSVLAVALVVTTLTFGNSLQTLVSSPALYGWNWTYILNPVGAGSGNVPHVAFSLLKHDRYVAAYSGASFNSVEIDGQDVPFLVEDVGADVVPPILSGHGVDAAKQIVLGAATMAQLHKHLGQHVTVTYGAPADTPIYLPPTRLLIVGTATFPAIGFASTVSDHTSMGSGAYFSFQMFPKRFDAAINSGPDPRWTGRIWRSSGSARVRHRSRPWPACGTSRGRPTRSTPLRRAGRGATSSRSRACSARPRSSTTRRSGSRRPSWSQAWRWGPSSPLALTLLASVRQRRRDLALLKTIGFVRRQLAAAVAWQATVAAVVGMVVGIPLGLVTGRWLWDLFARQIYAVPYPTVSVVSVILVALGTLVLANVVAAVPAERGAHADGTHVAVGVGPIRYECRPTDSMPSSTKATTSRTHTDRTPSGLLRMTQCPASTGRRHMSDVHSSSPSSSAGVTYRSRMGTISCTGTSVCPATRSAPAVDVGPVESTPWKKSVPNVGAGQCPSVWACSILCNAAAHRLAARLLRVISSGSSGSRKYAMYQECSAWLSTCRRSCGLREL